MIDYSKILSKNYVGKCWCLSGNKYEDLQWFDKSLKPTKEELDSQWENIDKNIKQNEYKELRAKEYPAIADQLDYIYHNGIDAWKTDMIDPVKNKYPKG